MKIVFISHDPLTKTVENLFLFNDFITRGITVEYWYVGKLTRYARSLSVSNTIQTAYSSEFTSFETLRRKIREQAPETYFCIELWFNHETYSIYKELQPRFDHLFSIDWYINSPHPPVSGKIMAELRKLNLRRLILASARKIRQYWVKAKAGMQAVRPPGLLFAPGNAARPVYSHQRLVPLHHHDYAAFKNTVVPPNERTGNYAVFLDSMLPNHPDLVRLKQGSIDHATYFEKMNRLFSHLEQILNLRVIIAAHPKSDYHGEFQGRETVKYKTNELVKYSSLVIAHQSNSIYFAVLHNKPLLLPYTNEFLEAGEKNRYLRYALFSIRQYAQLLHADTVNIDDLEDMRLKEADTRQYEWFVEQYMKGAGSGNNIDIILQELTKKYQD